ncbi:hypothetical protein [Bacillus spizizenii]|jgi:hypothetical protein|uniref:hypothetical protein n=2 Tax=Bacillus spizizenii TaxID=96241 RepID=UPI0005A2BADB|nr:hypothetical protein [Bacillus spizizenii]OWV36496.1 hypothetical protein CE489_13065 [Bacillus spizizenii]GEK25937.1 hypothetical protein BSU04nite_23260 [Bacillus spizizenii]CUB26574.1 hypothetical protein BN2127_JRS1_08496 [Bacillus cereus]CUB38101.1 hypothetical protein BN2127_JRS7_01363 [Bacillus subtilis]
MKKFLGSVVIGCAVLFSSFMVHQESASAASQVETILQKSQTSNSTKRIKVKAGQNLQVRVFPFNNKTIKLTVFKNGKAWTSNLTSSPSIYDYTYKNPGAAEYSLRLYCGKNGGQKGCYGQGLLTVR